jgi:uncharacterized protein (DUF1501 family)
MKTQKDTQETINKNSNEMHEMDHHYWSRRNFIKTLGLTGGIGLAMGGFAIDALAGVPMLLASAGGINDRILVLIRLKGGNDGLNMIVPLFDYSTYKSKRPTIAIPQGDIIKLDNDAAFGIPKTMNSLKRLWDDGQMKVINSVGYSDHNLSHFTSADIWNSANKSIESDSDKSGWLGRYILDQNPDFLKNLPAIPAAIKVSSGSNIAYQNSDRIDLAVNFNTPDRLIEVATKGFLFDTVNLPDNCYYGDQIGYLRSIMNVTYKYAAPIKDAYTKGQNQVTYSNNELSRQLAIVAKLIKGNLGTKLYMVTLEGFDTHENQNQDHPKLMNTLSNAINEFYTDLSKSDKDKEVLSMTFSEFGRRISENNGGTDHGTAAPVMLFGPALNGNSLLGKDPDLSNVDSNGNLKHGTDFRSIYATILEQWLCLDPLSVDNVLGDHYDRMDGLGFDCTSVGTTTVAINNKIMHKARPDGQGGYVIEYELSKPGPIKVEVYNIMGQKVASLVNEYQLAGKHSASFSNYNTGLTMNVFVYRISAGNAGVSGKFVG